VRAPSSTSVRKLDPRRMIRNPVMFVVEVGSAFTTLLFVHALVTGEGEAPPASVHPSPSRSGSGSPCSSRTSPRRWPRARQGAGRHAAQGAQGRHRQAPRARARRDADAARGSPVLVRAPQGRPRPRRGRRPDPGDGEIVEGVASVDESAITGESAPVIRESGGDRSAVTGGTRVLSDWLIVRITANPGETFLDRMIAMVEGAKRQKTPNEIALDILLAALTIVFLSRR
jgi:K+-transporting ATPase ATPase B chain